MTALNVIQVNLCHKILFFCIYLRTHRPQYDDRLFIELQVQYMKIPSSNLCRTCCVQKLFLTFRTIFVHNMFSPGSAKRRASDKDLPVFMLKLTNVAHETAQLDKTFCFDYSFSLGCKFLIFK